MLELQRHRVHIRVCVEVEQEEDGSYIAFCPQVGCVFVHEETEDAVLEAVEQALGQFVRVSIRHGDPLPDCIVLEHTVQDSASPFCCKEKGGRTGGREVEMNAGYTIDLPVAAG